MIQKSGYRSSGEIMRQTKIAPERMTEEERGKL
jgi:hypothetical protein